MYLSAKKAGKQRKTIDNYYCWEINSVPSISSVLALLNMFGSYSEPAALSGYAERSVFSSSELGKSLKCYLQLGKINHTKCGAQTVAQQKRWVLAGMGGCGVIKVQASGSIFPHKKCPQAT